MDYLKIKRNLENYTVRNIPKSVIIVNASGETVHAEIVTETIVIKMICVSCFIVSP